jgi:hypothetical protein
MTSEITRGEMVIATNCQNTAAQRIGEIVHELYRFSFHIYVVVVVVVHIFFRSNVFSGAFMGQNVQVYTSKQRSQQLQTSEL